jgi:hypothetical protein
MRSVLLCVVAVVCQFLAGCCEGVWWGLRARWKATWIRAVGSALRGGRCVNACVIPDDPWKCAMARGFRYVFAKMVPIHPS